MKLALRMFWRDFRAGELTLLLAAVVLAVSVVTSISIFAERMRSTLITEAGTVLAADLALQGSQPAQPEWVAWAQALELEQAEVVSFASMLFSETGQQLASVRAVTETYPLKGSVQVASAPFTEGEAVPSGPAAGEIWLASRLFPILDVAIGDRIGIGQTELVVTRALIAEPDQTTSLFNVEPRALMHMDDLAATGAVQVGSRVTYRWLLAGSEDQLQALRNRIGTEHEPHMRWREARGANDTISDALDRAERFLLLAGSLAVLLAGLALALAAQRYATRHVDGVAVMKTLGFTPNQILRLYGMGLVALAAIGVGLGLLVGETLHQTLLWVLRDVLPPQLAPATIASYAMGALTGFIALMGFAWPPFFQLRQVPPVRVLRSDTYQQGRWYWQLWGVLGVVLLLWLYSQSLLLTLVLMVGGLICILGSTLLAQGLIALLRYGGARLGRAWRLGLANLQRQRRQSGLQVVIFAVVLMLMFTLTLVRTSLLTQWQQQLPDDVPNHFVYNVFADERPELEQWLNQYATNASPIYPVTRGRLQRVNTDTVDALSEGLPDRGNLMRELNMTWTPRLAPDNEVVAGSWWSDYGGGELQVSVEQDFAQSLGIGLGDALHFSVGGFPVAAQVASIRTLDWSSFHPNFYMIFNQPLAASEGAFYLVSFHLPVDQKVNLNALIRSIPTAAVLEVDGIIEQVQDIVRQVTTAIEFMLVMILISGLLVLLAGIQSSLDQRFREGALMRTLGARKAMLRQALWIEFGALGATAGLLGAAATEVILFYLQTQLFDLPAQWHPLLWLLAPILGAVFIGAVGVLATRSVLRVPPLQILRHWLA